MGNTAASINTLEFVGRFSGLEQNYQKAHLMLVLNLPCSPEVGLGKLMMLE